MKKALLLTTLAMFIFGGAARGEFFGIGGGLVAYPIDLRELKEELVGLGAPAEELAEVPDLLPLPHLGLRGRLGLPIPISAQLEVARLSLALAVDQETGLSLGVTSTVISFSLLGELRILFLGLALGIGTGLIQGGLSLEADDPQMAAVLEQLGLDNLAWSAATVHSLSELHLILGPLRLYLAGKYLYPLSGTGPKIGFWEAGLGLMILI